MTWEEENDQRDGTQIQQAIIYPVSMVSNQRTHLTHAPIERSFIITIDNKMGGVSTNCHFYTVAE